MIFSSFQLRLDGKITILWKWINRWNHCKVDKKWRLRASISSYSKRKYYSLKGKHSEKCTDNNALQYSFVFSFFQFSHQSNWCKRLNWTTTYSLISQQGCVCVWGFNGTSVNDKIQPSFVYFLSFVYTSI